MPITNIQEASEVERSLSTALSANGDDVVVQAYALAVR